MKDGFAVRAAFELVPAGQEVLPQLLKIIDLAVEDKMDGFVLITHGLAACRGKIDDAQSAMSQSQ